MKLTLKAARINAQLTRAEVATKVRKSENTIANYEQGRSTPDVETAKALASLFGMPVDDINFLPTNCAFSTK